MADNTIDLAVDGGEQVTEIRSLLAVLRDDDLRGLVPKLRRGAVGVEDLGTADEIVQLVLDPKLVIGVAGVLTTWLTTRKRAVTLRVKQRGKELSLEAGSPKDAERILGQLKEFLDEA
jgi:hypothetical protein